MELNPWTKPIWLFMWISCSLKGLWTWHRSCIRDFNNVCHKNHFIGEWYKHHTKHSSTQPWLPFSTLRYPRSGTCQAEQDWRWVLCPWDNGQHRAFNDTRVLLHRILRTGIPGRAGIWNPKEPWACCHGKRGSWKCLWKACRTEKLGLCNRQRPLYETHRNW